MAILSLATLRDWGVTLLDLTFPEMPLEGKQPKPIEPPLCERCGQPYEGAITTEFQCTNCHDRVWHFTAARALYPSEGCVRDVIHGFKYRQQFYHRRRLIDWLDTGFARHLEGQGTWDALVPVPLYRVRYRERGFNQALELARGLGKRRHIPVTDCLERCRETPTQTRLSREERWRNLRGAFGLRSGFDVRGQNLLLIDDVFTTGATCEGCAQVLHQAGAGTIGVLTVARG